MRRNFKDPKVQEKIKENWKRKKDWKEQLAELNLSVTSGTSSLNRSKRHPEEASYKDARSKAPNSDIPVR